jgi:ABC-type Zn uptake system ZnuABC Zn-binding protein ZnuA
MILDIVRGPVRRLLPALLIAAVSAGGCSDERGGPAVVATTTQAGDITRAVAGGDIAVEQILRPGADPHEYEPRPSDAQAVAGARLIVRSGGDVDGWLDGLIGQAGGDAKILPLIDTVDRHGDDPHWWQDPRNGEKAVTAIATALAQADPPHAAGYRSRAAAYLKRLKALDGGIARCVGQLPPEARKLVTDHDALGYYARRYGFTVTGAAIPSLSTQAQPSAAAIQRLVNQIKSQHVAAIFPEHGLNQKLEQAIAREAHARVGGALYADALGPRGSAGATYLGSLAANTRTIVSGLSRGRTTCASLTQ